MSVIVEPLTTTDVAAAASVHAAAFPRQRNSHEWISAKLRAFPATHSYSAKVAGEVVAGILWTHKSGFREKAVLELEQIFVRPDKQRQGIGTQLILTSLAHVDTLIRAQGFQIGTICVNTRSDNNAMKLYERTLGVRKIAELEGHTPNATEVFLAATDVKLEELPGFRQLGR